MRRIAAYVVMAFLGGLIAALTSVASFATAAPATNSPAAQTPDITPLVIGHRGAAGYRPEHTAGGYALAARLGADYLEPDLVPTKDGHLVDRHEPDISTTTDVAAHPEFAHLKTTKTIDGVRTRGWFTTDFTLRQLRTLRAIERLPNIREQNTRYNGRFRIPTFQEDIDQAKSLSRIYHRTIGIIPEIKHSTYFRSIGLPLGQRVLDVLHDNGLDGPRPALPTVIQSFEVGPLKWLHAHSVVPLLQLTSASGAPADFIATGDARSYADITSAHGLVDVATYADYLGPSKNQILPQTSDGYLGTPTSLVQNAHRAGLLVTPYTFRNENMFLPLDYRVGTDPAVYGDAVAEYKLFYSLGVDGLFSDNSDTAILARNEWIAEGRPHLAAA